jgi:hypothetical protein
MDTFSENLPSPLFSKEGRVPPFGKGLPAGRQGGEEGFLKACRYNSETVNNEGEKGR